MKRHVYHKKDWKECVPVGNNPELRRMLLVGHGCLCLVDTTDAVIRSGAEPIQMLLRMNMIAWARFAFSAFQEIRMLYSKDALNILEMEQDLDNEWHKLKTSDSLWET